MVWVLANGYNLHGYGNEYFVCRGNDYYPFLVFYHRQLHRQPYCNLPENRWGGRHGCNGYLGKYHYWATTVYTGTPGAWTVGWNTIDITDFALAANQSLEVLVECNTGGSGIGTSTSTAFQYTSGAAGSNAYWQADNTGPTGTQSISNTSRPNIILAGLAPVPVPSCTTNLLPVTGATGLIPPLTLSWNAAPAAASYTLFVGTTNPPVAADSITTVGSTSVSLSGGAPNTTYYWYVVPKNGVGTATGCAANTTSYTLYGGPANDLCSNATNLTVSNGFCGAPVLGSLIFADSTTGLGGASCQASALKYDVWYKVTVPATGKVTVQTSAVNTTVTDLILQAYSGSCGALTSIGCDDDGNTDASPSTNHSKLGLTGRAPGEVIYFRVMPYNSSTNVGAFAICAFDTTASVMPAIASGSANSCTPAISMTIDSAYKYTWATFKDAGGNVVAQLYPNGNILGSTSASFYINSGAVRKDPSNIYYLDRNITITPANQPTSSVTTGLFFKDAELTAFAAAAGTTVRANMNVSKTTQTCATSAIAGNGTLLSQTGNSAYGTDHFVTVSNPSFSTFYLHKGSIALPIKFEYLKGRKVDAGNALTWKVTCTSTSITMQLERSTDSRNFASVTSISATQARCGQPFDYTDAIAARGTVYYRLKMIDIDGTVAYSPIVAIISASAGAELVGIYPTLVQDIAYLSVSASHSTKMQITISDMSGKTVRSISETVNIGSSLLSIKTDNLAAGLYNISGILNGVPTKTLRFVKQ